MMYGWWGSGWGSIAYTLVCVAITLCLIGAITAIVLAALDAGGSRTAPGRHREKQRRPDDVLSERFARGDIDEDEYRRRMSLMRGHR